MKKKQTFRARFCPIVAGLTLLLSATPTHAQQAPAKAPAPAPAVAPVVTAPLLAPVGYAQLWVDKTATVTPEAVKATLAELAKQEKDPQQIVIMIHGFDVTRDESTDDFNGLTARLKDQLKGSSTRVGYVGLQWESAADTNIFGLDKAYFSKIPLARSVGHGPSRQLLLAIQKRYPKAHLSVMAHSMGCEVVASTIVPEYVYPQYQPFVAPYEPDQDLHLTMAVLAGSDLNYDAWYTSNITARERNLRCDFLWGTVSPYLKGGDDVLALRGHIRGKAAGGALPRMTLAQLDTVIPGRRIYLDSTDIPSDHAFEKYYSASRLSHVVPALLYLSDKSAPEPPELAELDAILAAPNDLPSLLPYLDSPREGSIFYALWRLERLNCGDARHLSDGTLEAVARLMRSTPQKIWKLRPKSECITVQKGEFPTEKQMISVGAPPWAHGR